MTTSHQPESEQNATTKPGEILLSSAGKQISLQLRADGAKVTGLQLVGKKLYVTIEAELEADENAPEIELLDEQKIQAAENNKEEVKSNEENKINISPLKNNEESEKNKIVFDRKMTRIFIKEDKKENSNHTLEDNKIDIEPITISKENNLDEFVINSSDENNLSDNNSLPVIGLAPNNSQLTENKNDFLGNTASSADKNTKSTNENNGLEITPGLTIPLIRDNQTDNQKLNVISVDLHQKQDRVVPELTIPLTIDNQADNQNRQGIEKSISIDSAFDESKIEDVPSSSNQQQNLITPDLTIPLTVDNQNRQGIGKNISIDSAFDGQKLESVPSSSSQQQSPITPELTIPLTVDNQNRQGIGKNISIDSAFDGQKLESVPSSSNQQQSPIAPELDDSLTIDNTSENLGNRYGEPKPELKWDSEPELTKNNEEKEVTIKKEGLTWDGQDDEPIHQKDQELDIPKNKAAESNISLEDSKNTVQLDQEEPKEELDSYEQKAKSGSTTVLIRYTCPRCKTQGMQSPDKVGSIVKCANCGKAMRLVVRKK